MSVRFLSAQGSMMPDIIELLEVMGLDDDDLIADEFIVAVENDEIVAIGRVREHDDVLELASVGVIEEERGKGIGRQLVKELLQLYPNETVYCVSEIPVFFEKLNFKVTAEFPEVIGEKLSRCKEQLNCESPLVLIHQ